MNLRRLIFLTLLTLLVSNVGRAQVLKPVESPVSRPQAESNASLLEKMQGTWKIASATFNGKPFPNADKMQLAIEKDRYSLVSDGSVLDRGLLKVDTTQSPYHLDIEGTEGANAGTKLSCIIRFEKEKMTVCYQLDGDGARPSKFESPEGQAILLANYERVTAPKDQ